MLTIQPNLVNSYGKTPAFGRHEKHAEEYVDYVDVTDINPEDNFENSETKQELDLLKQTKQNIDELAQTTKSVPVVNKVLKAFSGLIAVAIGWCGLRWGAEGTLEAIAKINKTKMAKSIKRNGNSAYTTIKGWMTSGKGYIKDCGWYKSIANTMSGAKESFLNTTVGETLVGWKNTVKANPVYNRIVKTKNNTVAKVRKLNPKNAFVETMGVAGGGTATVEVLGGKPVNRDELKGDYNDAA